MSNLTYDPNPELRRIPSRVRRYEVLFDSEKIVTASELRADGWTRVWRVQFLVALGIGAFASYKSECDLYLRNRTAVTVGPFETGSAATEGATSLVYEVELMSVDGRLREFVGTPPVNEDWLLRYRNTQDTAPGGIAAVNDFLTILGD